MPKLSDIDKVVYELESQKRVIDAALDLLKQARGKALMKSQKRPRVVKKPDEKTA